MAKSIVEKASISIKGILNLADGTVEVDGNPVELEALLDNYDGKPVVISVATTTDIV